MIQTLRFKKIIYIVISFQSMSGQKNDLEISSLYNSHTQQNSPSKFQSFLFPIMRRDGTHLVQSIDTAYKKKRNAYYQDRINWKLKIYKLEISNSLYFTSTSRGVSVYRHDMLH